MNKKCAKCGIPEEGLMFGRKAMCDDSGASHQWVDREPPKADEFWSKSLVNSNIKMPDDCDCCGVELPVTGPMEMKGLNISYDELESMRKKSKSSQLYFRHCRIYGCPESLNIYELDDAVFDSCMITTDKK